MKKIALYISILSILFIFLNCGGGSGSGKNKGASQITIKATFKDVSATSGIKAAASTIINIRYTISGPGMTTITGLAPVVGNMVEISLVVPNGSQRLFVIEALDALGDVKYYGSAEKDLDGTPVEIEITMKKAERTLANISLFHLNDGRWGSRITIDTHNDITGIQTYTDNLGGIVTTKTENYTNTITDNQDGSTTVTQTFPNRTTTRRIVYSDDGKILLFVSDTMFQIISLSLRMNPLRTYSNADLAGEYYSIGYDYDPNKLYTLGNYNGWSGLVSFNGNGNYSYITTWNSDGKIITENNSATYSVGSNGSLTTRNGIFTGYTNGEGLFITSHPTANDHWKFTFGMKKADRVYSTADLAGTWIFADIGDEDIGSRFHEKIGTLICDVSGNCLSMFKTQENGEVTYDGAGFHPGTIMPDGTCGFGYSSIAPSYACAIGNNGNTMILNMNSFRADELEDREIMIGVKCNKCFNIPGYAFPLIHFFKNSNDKYISNLYVREPSSGIIVPVKTNLNNATPMSMDTKQKMVVYTEKAAEDTYTIYIYDMLTGTTKQITSATTKEDSAYFDDDGQILFIDSVTGELKKMNSDGTDIATIASPEAPYSFEVLWMSPDREKIIVQEGREEVDYNTGHYARLVMMNGDGTGRSIVFPEYLGDWNMLTWKPGSKGFLFYHHDFYVVNGVREKKIPKYVAVDFSTGPVKTVDLSNSALGKEENVLLYTLSGNLLSLTYRELYNGNTGAFIASRNDVPVFKETMVGSNYPGLIYFANLDGSNFRIFKE